MPFSFDLLNQPVLLPHHVQAKDDPVRAAAEAIDPLVRGKLFMGWTDLGDQLARYTPDRITSSDTLQRIGSELSSQLQLIGRDLLAARLLGRRAMESQVTAATLLRKDFSVSFQFNRQAPLVQQQAEQYAARFVREIGDDTRTTLATLLQRGIEAGEGPEEIARTLRDSIGLTTAQAQAVKNYRRLLETGNTEALQRALRDRRFDVEPEDLMKLTPEQIDARVEAYHRRYLMFRANTIARYETLYASNAGSMSAVQEAVGSGALPHWTVKTWMVAGDEITCDRCRSIPELQPDGVAFAAPFIWQSGGKRGRSGEIDFAPLHPNCRCTNGFHA